MTKINTILVGLDFSDTDETLIKYVIRMSHKTDLRKVYFVNVQTDLDLPKEITDKYPDLMAPKDEQLNKLISEKLESSSEGKLNCEYEISILEGKKTDKILKWSKVKDVDLLIVGKKLDFNRHEVSAGKLAKMAPCSVFFIPEVMPSQPIELVVPIDFSDHSLKALEHALFLSSIFTELQIFSVHFYEVPQGYHLTGKNKDEFAELMEKNAQKEYDKFIAKLGSTPKNVHFDVLQNKSGSTAEEIYKYAIREQASGIVIGSKGRTMAASIILGSVAEKLLHINTHFPLYISKEKNKNLDFFGAMMD